MESFGKNDISIQTQIIAKEHGISPETPVYRALHPVMICEKIGDKYLIRGNKDNGTAVYDDYGEAERRTRASGLPEPGLNFTKEKSDNYVSDSRRSVVSMKMADQPAGLRIYQDVGSEERSVYFTLPEDKYFVVTLEKSDPGEIELSLEIHKLMKELDVKDEPVYRDFIKGGKDGYRVLEWLKDGFEVHFIRSGSNELTINHFKVREGMDKSKVQELAIKRLLMELKDLKKIIGFDGKDVVLTSKNN